MLLHSCWLVLKVHFCWLVIRGRLQELQIGTGVPRTAEVYVALAEGDARVNVNEVVHERGCKSARAGGRVVENCT